jgi:hypothetical protein
MGGLLYAKKSVNPPRAFADAPQKAAFIISSPGVPGGPLPTIEEEFRSLIPVK